jgi:hypothetical protein
LRVIGCMREDWRDDMCFLCSEAREGSKPVGERLAAARLDAQRESPTRAKRGARPKGHLTLETIETYSDPEGVTVSQEGEG